MKVAFQNFIDNPYKDDENFPSKNSPNRIIDPNIKLVGEENKIILSTPISHYFSKG